VRHPSRVLIRERVGTFSAVLAQHVKGR
jgi:hypothetical protein